MSRFALTTVVALALVGVANSALAQDTATVEVRMRGLKPNAGKAIVLLYDTESGFDGNKPAQTQMVEATAAAVSATFSGLKPGRYAIRAFDDINNNNAYDQGVDGLAFSNHVTMDDPSHAPTFSDTSFMVKSGANVQQMTFAVSHGQ